MVRSEGSTDPFHARHLGGYKIKALTAKKELAIRTIGSQTTEEQQAPRMLARQVFIAPAGGRHYHMKGTCGGLAVAGEKRVMKVCERCAVMTD